jgi:unsaturated chondroitin disaccharide hydrolase
MKSVSSLSDERVGVPVIERAYCERAIDFVLRQIDKNLAVFAETFPAPVSTGNIYKAIPNNEWTTSFWTGMVWLAYEVTGNSKYRAAAEKQVADFQGRLEKRVATETHDLGFLYILSCLAGYKITGSEVARATALKAADRLMERFFEKAGIIQAWGNLHDPRERGRMIIDCCMNLPLLYWASQVTGKSVYHDAATRHAEQAGRYLVRSDASTYHTYFLDPDSGAPIGGKTNQGFSDDSCWSRGQAWGVYGFALSYLYTSDEKFLSLAKKLADYFIARLPADSICYWDLAFTDGAEERDSSAAVILACGLMELNKHLPITDPARLRYEAVVGRILRSLTENYLTVSAPESNGILLHAVYSKNAGEGVDECSIWGDYFYFEALVRAVKSWRIYW